MAHHPFPHDHILTRCVVAPNASRSRGVLTAHLCRFTRANPSTLDVPADFFDVPASFAEDLKEKRAHTPPALLSSAPQCAPVLSQVRAQV